jgi:hypothetical protein
MKNLAYTLLSQLEKCLTRQPSDEFLWGAWITLSGLVENRRYRDLKQDLVLAPLYDPLDLPPLLSRGVLLRLYSSRSNWQGIIDVQEWIWEANRDQIAAEKPFPLWWQWGMGGLRYLLEAYLRLGKDSEANELVGICSTSPEWGDIKQSAVALAEKCGKTELAERWKK